MAKLLTTGIPSMCCFNGNAIANGFIIGLCHDFRIMKNKGKIGLPENPMGTGLPRAYNELVAAKLNPETYLMLMYGHYMTPQEALKSKSIGDIY